MPDGAVRVPRRSLARSSAVGVVFAVLSLLPALAVYYVAVGIFMLFAIASALGASPQVVDPPGFEAMMMAIIYVGPVWALAMATVVYRAVGPLESRWARTPPADALIVIGSGLMAAAIGLCPAILAVDEKRSIVLMVSAGVAFMLGAGLASVFAARSRSGRQPEACAETS